MADKEPESERQKYVKDPRIACKYGLKCYQKSSIHQQKYKHPPPKRANNDRTTQPKKRFRMDDDITDETQVKKNSGSIQDKEMQSDNSNQETIDTSIETNASKQEPEKIDSQNKEETNKQNQEIDTVSLGKTPKDFDHKDFIKEKFLVEMPEDFYSFWDFCKELKEKCPQEAMRDIGLTLIGPYDVLAGKFNDVSEQPQENYLIHWRYFYDPPEFQTVLKGDDRTGFHIGYFRDSPDEMPVYLASNFSKTDGTFKVMGSNIFAAVNLYLEDLKKMGDPFKKMHIGKYQNAIKKKSEELNMSLLEKTDEIRNRDKKVVTRSFSRMGIIVPYNRRTQVGYRDLGMTKKELIKLLNSIDKSLPEQKQKFLSDLQDIITNVSIATDECDFGTGIELGLNILAHGVESLNQTASRLLATNYRLIGKEGFARIAEAHMKNRKRGVNLSII